MISQALDTEYLAQTLALNHCTIMALRSWQGFMLSIRIAVKMLKKAYQIAIQVKERISETGLILIPHFYVNVVK